MNKERRVKKPIDRFLKKVKKTDKCWLWTSSLSPSGYGDFHFNGKLGKAHRFSYEHHIGKIPEGLILHHICENKICVNPDHLKPMDNWKNVLLGNSAVAINSRKTHCKFGHPLSGENLQIKLRKNGNKFRKCITCYQKDVKIGYLKYKKITAKNLKEYKLKNMDKVKAQRILNYSTVSGRISRPTVCEICKNIRKIDGHHEDYTKPLEVRWLCRKCHIGLHLRKKGRLPSLTENKSV